MNKKHRLLCLVIALVLSIGCAVTAFAASGSLDNFKKTNSYSAGQFSDVASTDWFASSVKTAYELGLMKGGAGSTFNHSGKITIAETLALACRLRDIYTGGTGTFTQGNPWYQVYVDYATDNGIITSGEFSSYTANATRAQFA